MLKTKFKPILLFTDNGMIIRKTKEAREKAPKYQEIVSAAETFLNRKLAVEEKKLILQNKFDGAITLLKQQMNMPNAETETILNIHGDNGASLRSVFEKHFHLNLYDFDSYEIKENEFVLSKNTILQIAKLGEYWTKSEAGNEAYKLAKTLCETFNNAVDKGYLYVHNGKEFWRATDNLTSYTKTTSGHDGVEPNYEKIARI
jgi:hypothetical protein